MASLLLLCLQVSCVGKNDLKQCGQSTGGADVTSYSTLVPLPDMTGANPAVQLSVGRAHACECRRCNFSTHACVRVPMARLQKSLVCAYRLIAFCRRAAG